MTRSFASSVADVAGSWVEPDLPGAFGGNTWGSEGIVGSSGGPRLRFGRGIGNGGGGNGGGGGSGGSRANASWLHGNIVAPAASTRTSAQVGQFNRRNVFAVIVHLLIQTTCDVGLVPRSRRAHATPHELLFVDFPASPGHELH